MTATPERTTTAAPQEGTLTVAQCWARLRTVKYGRLATSSEDGPDIFPVNHLVDHGTVVFRSDSGSKVRTAKGQRVAFEVDGVDGDTNQAWSVVVKGRVREVVDVDEVIDILDSPLVPWQRGSKARLLRLEPVDVSGRQFRLRPTASAS